MGEGSTVFSVQRDSVNSVFGDIFTFPGWWNLNDQRFYRNAPVNPPQRPAGGHRGDGGRNELWSEEPEK